MKTIRYIFSLLLFSLSFLLQSLFCAEPVGTLVVTYRTDAKSERLDRIRFWLKNTLQKQRLYPKGKSYVDESHTSTRKVVIENLAVGDYWIEFLVPNTDDYFEGVPMRHITVTENEVAKIDQTIHPRRSAAFHSSTEVCGRLIVFFETDAENSSGMKFSLIDDLGKATKHPIASQDTELPLKKGRLFMVDALPAGDYTLQFYLEDDQQQLSFPKRSITVVANKAKSIYYTHSREAPTIDKKILPINIPSVANFDYQN